MTPVLQSYAETAGEDVVDQLRQLAARVRGLNVVHVNSARMGGGVAEILPKLVAFMRELEIDARWQVMSGSPEFYQCTKSFHNALQGKAVDVPPRLIKVYERTNAENAEALRPLLKSADMVFIHDPQPAALLKHVPDRVGKWVWRCHVDARQPGRATWRYLRSFVADYDASIFSLAAFAQPLPHPQYLIPPSIDPLSDKNVELDQSEISAVRERFGLDAERPLMVQVSRYDRFKDPIGVIQAYRLAKTFVPGVQLVLAGGAASDDPEGQAVAGQVQEVAGDDADIHVLLLPPDSHRTINALQRAADIVLQKSIREGFGLTVTEGMWKGKPVIGGDTGGIRLQVVNHHTGFLVSTPEGAALRTRYLLHNRDKMREMGGKAREFVRENFLITRHLREYLTLMVALTHGGGDRLELG